jgi:beta-barrel assembly-enhancing protease
VRYGTTLLKVALAAALGGFAGCSTAPLHDMQPGTRPEESSDEAGLWAALDQAELALQKSPLRIHDPALNAYVKDLVCRMAGPHCGDIRVYLIRRPYFNASMAPNGVMQVWSGALLRAENEAQLAFVLGHEIGHYLHQHSIKQWRRQKAIADTLSILQLLVARSGSANAGDAFDLTTIAAYASLFKYSRDAEREADRHGFESSVMRDYDAAQSWLLWQGLLAEENARDRRKPSSIFATHPASEERLTTLRLASESFGGAGKETGEADYLRSTAPYFAQWLGDELQRRHFPQTLVLLQRLGSRSEGGHRALIDYYVGELFRRRRAPGDDKRAIDAYNDCLAVDGCPAQAHRDIGYVFRSQTLEPKTARFMADAPAVPMALTAFRRYLQRVPDADDAATIKLYIQQLEAAHAPSN